MDQVILHGRSVGAVGCLNVDVPWYALSTQAGKEEDAVRDLVRRNIEFLLPKYKARRKWKDHAEEIVFKPLFPGYLFSPARTSAYAHVVKFGARPEPLSVRDLASIRLLVEHGINMEPEDALAVEPGDMVELTSGPMRGAYGRVVQRRDDLRLVVTLDMLGRSCSTIIERDWIGDVIRRRRVA